MDMESVVVIPTGTQVILISDSYLEGVWSGKWCL